MSRLKAIEYTAAAEATREAGYTIKPIQTRVLLSKQTMWINDIQKKVEHVWSVNESSGQSTLLYKEEEKEKYYVNIKLRIRYTWGKEQVKKDTLTKVQSMYRYDKRHRL